MALNLSILKTNKEEILKAEIGALLFNLGKTHIGFWEEKNGIKYFNIDKNLFKSNYGYELFRSYKEYYKGNYPPFEIDLSNVNVKLKDFIFNEVIRLLSKQVELKELMFGNSSSEDFVKNVFFRGCENINSGIDKGSPQDSNQLQKLYIANAFGAFKREFEENSLDKSRLCFFQNFHRFLEGNHYYTLPDWKKIRNFVLGEVKPWYSRILSDSRFPVNDVTLWDQAYMTASLFKAVISVIFLDSSLQLGSFEKDPQSVKWSILGIQYDKLGLAEKGLKPGSIDWYRNASVEVDDKIKELIEVDYPLGNEVYRDETGIYFVVSEKLIDNTKIEGDFYKLNQGLDEVKGKILDVFRDKFDGEVYPSILLTKPSRGIMNLGHLVEKSEENFLKAEIPDDFDSRLKKKDDADPNGLCQICGMRLAHREGNKDSLICDVCEERKKGRIDKWINNRKGETIWTGELQDKNGKIALVTLKFELNEWINGDLINSFVAQHLDLSGKKYSDYLNDITNGIKSNKKLNNTLLKDYHTNVLNISLRELIKKWLLERSIGSQWEKFISNKVGYCHKNNHKKIDFDKQTIDWQCLEDADIEFLSELFLQFLLRKNPSPARLRRVWETTKEFFEYLEKELLNIAEIPENRCKRLVWKKGNYQKGNLTDDGEYVDGDIAFWAKDNDIYLITSIDKVVNKKEFTLKKYDEKNVEQEDPCTLKIENATEEDYKPYFSVISPTPVSWQFIIPAENVPDLIKNIQKEYYKNFRWVYGKLPLHIGVVIQNYKKPLYIGIKALRKIRRDGQEWQSLGEEISAKDFKEKRNEALKWRQLPEKVSDCESFYSLFEKTSGSGKYEFYLYPDSKRSNKQILDIIRNSSDTDKFYFYPNTFDFEFLDTNTRRNDILYNNSKRLLDMKANRPYNLEDWQLFENFKKYFDRKKSSSKLQKLVSLIYSKISDWDDEESLKKFMISAFVNVLDLKSEEQKNSFAKVFVANKANEFDELKKTDAPLFKKKLLKFIDMFEFWHTAIKEV